MFSTAKLRPFVAKPGEDCQFEGYFKIGKECNIVKNIFQDFLKEHPDIKRLPELSDLTGPDGLVTLTQLLLNVEFEGGYRIYAIDVLPIPTKQKGVIFERMNQDEGDDWWQANVDLRSYAVLRTSPVFASSGSYPDDAIDIAFDAAIFASIKMNPKTGEVIGGIPAVMVRYLDVWNKDEATARLEDPNTGKFKFSIIGYKIEFDMDVEYISCYKEVVVRCPGLENVKMSDLKNSSPKVVIGGEKQPQDDRVEEQVQTIFEYLDKVPKEKQIEIAKRMFEHCDISPTGVDINEPIQPRMSSSLLEQMLRVAEKTAVAGDEEPIDPKAIYAIEVSVPVETNSPLSKLTECRHTFLCSRPCPPTIGVPTAAIALFNAGEVTEATDTIRKLYPGWRTKIVRVGGVDPSKPDEPNRGPIIR